MRRFAVWLLALLLCRPTTALQLPADAQQRLIHPGAWSFSIRRQAGPWAIDGFLWERSQPRLSVTTTAGTGKIRGLQRTSGQIAPLAGPLQRPIAAVNGDFFMIKSGPDQGALIGFFVQDGKLLNLPGGRPAFAVLSDGTPTIAAFQTTIELQIPGADAPLKVTRVNHARGPEHLVLYTPEWAQTTETNDFGLEVALRWTGKLGPNTDAEVEVVAEPSSQGSQRIPPGGLVLSGHGAGAAAMKPLKAGMKLRLVARTTPNLPVRAAVGGNQVLLKNGALAVTPKAGEPRHPRTMVGYDATHIIAVTVDGRLPGHSIGMTYPEQAALMKEFGCTDALNLDGGGSTTCWVRGDIVNRPSDGRERSVANALALVSQGPLGEPAMVAFEPAGPLWLAPGTTIKPRLRVTDALLNPLQERADVAVTVDGGVGRWDNGTFTAGTAAGRGALVAKAGAVEGRLDLVVVDQLTDLRTDPSRIELLPGEAVKVAVVGVGPGRQPVQVDPAALTWTVDGNVGSVKAGEFTGGPGTEGSLTISGYGARTTVPVRIAQPALIEDFETGVGGKLQVTPATATGTLQPVRDGAPSGEQFVRMNYHLGDTKETRAAYLRFDRKLPSARALRAMVRGDGQEVWLRAVVSDGNGVRTYHTLWQGPLKAEWQQVQTVLPPGLKTPLIWESVYLVSLASHTTKDGIVDWDRLEILRLP